MTQFNKKVCHITHFLCHFLAAILSIYGKWVKTGGSAIGKVPVGGQDNGSAFMSGAQVCLYKSLLVTRSRNITLLESR